MSFLKLAPICSKCGATTMQWDSSLVYKDSPRRVVWKCPKCNHEEREVKDSERIRQ